MRIRICPHVSRVHAMYQFENGVLFISDAGSENGTFVEKAKVEHRTEVPLGSKISVGGVTMKFVEVLQAAEAEQPAEFRTNIM